MLEENRRVHFKETKLKSSTANQTVISPYTHVEYLGTTRRISRHYTRRLSRHNTSSPAGYAKPYLAQVSRNSGMTLAHLLVRSAATRPPPGYDETVTHDQILLHFHETYFCILKQYPK